MAASFSVVPCLWAVFAILVFIAQTPHFIGGSIMTWVFLLVTIALIYVIPFVIKGIPAPLIAVVILSIIAVFMGADLKTVGDMGAIHQSLPTFLIPDIPWNFETLMIILPYSLALAVVGLVESDFDIAISIDVDFKKGNTFDSVGIRYDAEGVKIELTEENIKTKFPWSYSEMTSRCRTRYKDFKQDAKYNNLVKEIKQNKKLCIPRPLYFDNPKSQKTHYYNSNVLQFFDNHYTKK